MHKVMKIDLFINKINQKVIVNKNYISVVDLL